MRNPETREEWQTAVDAAHALLALQAARDYGLVAGGPIVHVERCEEILRAGGNRGFTPSKDAIENLVATLNA